MSDLGPLPPRPDPGACPACGSADLRRVLEQTAPVHTSKLLSDRGEAERYPRGVIRLDVCGSCGLLTNSAFDAPGHDYTASYEETQAFSPRFMEYAQALADELVARHGLAGTPVLEIGCGRADFLRLLVAASGGTGVGIDPSWRDGDAEDDDAGRVTVTRQFFVPGHVDRDFGLVVCRHTLEHVHAVSSFLGDLRVGLARHPGTPVFFEVPDTGRILRETAFWDIFYEHCSYFTPGSAARAFRAAGFAPVDLALGFDEQYVQLTATASTGADQGPVLELEEPVEQDVAEAMRFAADVDAARAHWRGLLTSARERGETAVIWGAGSKGVGFLATLELRDEIACAVDINPTKHGMFMPGTGHEIVPPERLRTVSPELVIVLNPAYEDEIRRDLAELGVEAEVVAL